MAIVNKRYKWFLGLILLVAVIFWMVSVRFNDKSVPGKRGDVSGPVPVKVAPVRHGPIELRRMFSGTLEATAEFVVAPKVGGRVKTLAVDLADPVIRGQKVAQLDNDEYVQAVAQARADLEVAKANLTEAKSALEISIRTLNRIETLRKRGVTSESQLDVARSSQLEKQAALAVAEAGLIKAKASLETANIRLGYTRVTADWSGGNDQRVVAERLIDEGNTVSANTPLLKIVELDPITAVIFVSEKDYARLENGQAATVTTDAFLKEKFIGHITRIAPVFGKSTRQARVELTIKNPAHKLKPGMFIRAEVVLDRIADAVIIPEQSLSKRNDRSGVFLISDGGQKAVWHEIDVGIRAGSDVQVKGGNLSGRVVILGQQLIKDGSAVIIPEDHFADKGNAE